MLNTELTDSGTGNLARVFLRKPTGKSARPTRINRRISRPAKGAGTITAAVQTGNRLRARNRAIAVFSVGCRRVFETHQNKARKVRLEDSTTPYSLPHSNKAMALSDRRLMAGTLAHGRLSFTLSAGREPRPASPTRFLASSDFRAVTDYRRIIQRQ